MEPKLEETIVIDFITSSSTGVATDADSLPTCEVFEDTNDSAILSPTVVKRVSKTGNYRLPITCSAANGFETDKSYNVVVSATLGGVAAKAVVARFQVRSKIAADIAADAAAAVFIYDASQNSQSDTFLDFIQNIRDRTDDIPPAPFIESSVDDLTATTTSFIGAAGLSATDDFYNGEVIAFTSGALKGLCRKVTDYVGSTRTFTLGTALPAAPANAVTFIILGRIE